MSYTIERATDAVPLTGTVAGTPWERADVATLDHYPWSTPPAAEPATARLLYDENTLYCQFTVPEDHVTAEETELNGTVWTDSAVELFFDPTPETPEYCNLEVNCIGTILFNGRTAEDLQRQITPDQAEAIDVETSVDEPGTDQPVSGDGWWLAAAIPFAVIATLIDEPVAPEPSDRWLGNFHQLRRGRAGTIGVWNPVDDPDRNLHQPEYFGEFRFGG
jgi:hypothetical protein